MTIDPGKFDFCAAVLDTLCPMHVRLDIAGNIMHCGPTLMKIIGPVSPKGVPFFDMFEILRPRMIQSVDGLRQYGGRKLHLRLKTGTKGQVKAVLANLPDGSIVVDFSFGIHVLDAVVEYDLTCTDFAPTDLTMEMLYLVEAKSAAMDASRLLNRRLQGAKVAAERRADTDTLTGLRNRRAMETALSRHISHSDTFALIHIDLDFFKQINDGFGHAAGDRVLQSVAGVMLDLTRPEDLVARVGGDEFVIILPGSCDTARLSEISHSLIRGIETPIFYGDDQFFVSASIGITLSMGDAKGGDQLLEEADIALYASKRAGRGQYTFYKPSMTLTRAAPGT